MKGACKRAGISYSSLHTLRHTFVSCLAMDGKDVRTIQELAGHSDARTTLRIYSHLVNGKAFEAVETSRLNREISGLFRESGYETGYKRVRGAGVNGRKCLKGNGRGYWTRTSDLRRVKTAL